MDIQQIEQHLWAAADKLRNNMDAAEYKHVVLGLIFLKYISDAFEQRHDALETDQYADSEDKDEYTAENIFWVPKEARWSFLKDNAKQPNIGVLIDDAMDAIERDNPSLKGVLPKNYAREALDKRRLGELIDTFSNITFGERHASKDLLGRIYEYFMGMFADAEGKRGGQFYTPRSIVRLLVNMLAPKPGSRVYDPCCGSGGMFVQSEEFIESHVGRKGDIAVYGQESNQTTWRLGKMNMAIRGIGAQIEYGDTLHNDKLPDLKADFVIANPPFNVSDWGGEQLRNDPRWQFGTPPVGNANFAWVQHFIFHLAPNGIAGFIMAASTLDVQGAEGVIRRNIIEANLVDCIITLPGQLFTNTGIPACIWVLSRNRSNRKNAVLFIDASGLGNTLGRKKREFSEPIIAKISTTYQNWQTTGKKIETQEGYSAIVDNDQISDNNFVLLPTRYIAPDKQEIQEYIKLSDQQELKNFSNIKNDLTRELNQIESSWESATVMNIQNAWKTHEIVDALSSFMNRIYNGLIVEYFIKDESIISRDKWEEKKFKDLFYERKQYVRDYSHIPTAYSVTNLGIQSRDTKYSKELSKDSGGYKLAFKGDMVFGLSREIPNLDVFRFDDGCFSPAYSVYAPYDPRVGLIVGATMRIRLMEQTDLLKGGAREGRGLDKSKLLNKTFLLPQPNELDRLWSNFS